MKQQYTVKHDSNLPFISLWHKIFLKQKRQDQYRIHVPTIQLMPQQALPLHVFLHFSHFQCVLMLHRCLVQMRHFFCAQAARRYQPPPQILKQNNPPPKPQILDYQSNVIVWDLLSKKAIFWMSRLVIQSCKNCYSTYFFPTLKMSYVTKMLINTGRNNNVALSYTFCSFLLYESIYEKSIKQWWWNTYVSHFNGF